MLKRKYARISIILLLAGVAIILLCPTFAHYDDVYGIITYCVGLAVVIAAFVVRYVFGRCPNCGKGSPIPRWSKTPDRYCPFCGERFIYDR
ncbi:MAG: hypothetical protein FWH33_07590 [Oscillospiraceae bacterium]|nr:hypothetical protein [Oscillospiraceae bacterium]